VREPEREPVSSGLGRNGPWLQNGWLRVESRLDDGSIAPVGLRPSFRPLERASASVDIVGESPLTFLRADYDLRAHEDRLGAGRLLALTCRLPERGVTLRREVALYDAHPFVVTRVGVLNERSEPIPLQALHAFSSPSRRGKLQFAAPSTDWRLYRHGWQSWSPTLALGGGARDVQSAPPVLSPELPQTDAGRFASDDVAVVCHPGSRRSLLAGVISARDFISQVVVDAPRNTIDARCLADGMALAPGEGAWSERLMVDVCGTSLDQLERYGDALAREMGARVPRRTPAGWCSWYYFYTQVTEDDVIRNLRYLEQHRSLVPVDTVQIDDGYQTDIGDWLSVNEKFPHGMRWLATQIRDAGYTPGIWTAPFLVAETSETYRAHPEFVVRDGAGGPVLAIDNWQRRNFALDGTHPGALAWLRDVFGTICDDWGYDYLKVDFLYAAAVAGVRHDPSATRVRAYRDALSAIRETAGERFILGCGSLMAPSVGLFDGNRIGPDVAPFWRFLTAEERARPAARPRTPDDQLSAETAIRNTLTRSWMHGRLWLNDPDCVMVRDDRTKLTLDETRTLVTAIGLSGGMVLSSDDLVKVPPERRELLAMMLPPLARSARPSDLMERDIPEVFELRVEHALAEQRLVALFNFDDEARDLACRLPAGEWHAFELWEERYLGVRSGKLNFALVVPHACRLVSLRPASGAPELVGTTAHIGMGILDVTGVRRVDDGLDVDLAAVGKPRRRLYFAAADGTVPEAEYEGAPAAVESSKGLARVELAVEQAATLRVRFRGVRGPR
jgi:alpha-galactosidase